MNSASQPAISSSFVMISCFVGSTQPSKSGDLIKATDTKFINAIYEIKDEPIVFAKDDAESIFKSLTVQFSKDCRYLIFSQHENMSVK